MGRAQPGPRESVTNGRDNSNSRGRPRPWRPRGRGRFAASLASVAALAALVLGAPGAAQAHPLGNFTVNRYAGIELSGGRAYIHYVLDLAEVPTFQDGGAVKAPRLPGGRGEEARAHSRRPPRPARCSRASGCRSPGSRRTQDAPLRRGVFGRGDRHPARLPRHQLRAPDRLARGDRCCAGRCAGAHLLGAGCQRKRRAALLSGRPAALSTRRDRRPGARCVRLRPGSAAKLRSGRAAEPSRRWLRSADREWAISRSASSSSRS